MPASTSTSLLTDELMMLDAARDGTAHRRCTFELLGRRSPKPRVAMSWLVPVDRGPLNAGVRRRADRLATRPGIISEEAAQFHNVAFLGRHLGLRRGALFRRFARSLPGTFGLQRSLETRSADSQPRLRGGLGNSRMTIAAHVAPAWTWVRAAPTSAFGPAARRHHRWFVFDLEAHMGSAASGTAAHARPCTTLSAMPSIQVAGRWALARRCSWTPTIIRQGVITRGAALRASWARCAWTRATVVAQASGADS